MGDIKTGQRYTVKASNGLKLRAEPTTESQVIVAMKNGEIVTVVAEDIQEQNGFHWYHIRYGEKTGWAASEYLQFLDHPIDRASDVPQGPPIAGDLLFTFDRSVYSIPKANIKKSAGKYIFAGTVGAGGQAILTVDGVSYWTTAANISRMRQDHIISLR